MNSLKIKAFLETVFSWYGFQVVSRLSFGIYILHFIPLSYRMFSVRDTYVMTDKLLVSHKYLLHFKSD